MRAVNGQVMHVEPIQHRAYGCVMRALVVGQEVAVKTARLRQPAEVDPATWLELGPSGVRWGEGKRDRGGVPGGGGRGGQGGGHGHGNGQLGNGPPQRALLPTTLHGSYFKLTHLSHFFY